MLSMAKLTHVKLKHIYIYIDQLCAAQMSPQRAKQYCLQIEYYAPLRKFG